MKFDRRDVTRLMLHFAEMVGFVVIMSWEEAALEFFGYHYQHIAFVLDETMGCLPPIGMKIISLEYQLFPSHKVLSMSVKSQH